MRGAHSSRTPPPPSRTQALRPSGSQERKGNKEKGLLSAPQHQMAAFLFPQPLTAGFTLEQKQEHEVAWWSHGGLGPEVIWPKTVVQRSPQNSGGEREVARTDVTRLVTILPTSCVWVHVCP